MKMLGNVRISMRGNRRSVKIDGVEMANHILEDGFAVEIPANPDEPTLVRMALVPHGLEVVLEDAVVEIVEPAGE